MLKINSSSELSARLLCEDLGKSGNLSAFSTKNEPTQKRLDTWKIKNYGKILWNFELLWWGLGGGGEWVGNSWKVKSFGKGNIPWVIFHEVFQIISKNLSRPIPWTSSELWIYRWKLLNYSEREGERGHFKILQKNLQQSKMSVKPFENFAKWNFCRHWRCVTSLVLVWTFRSCQTFLLDSL